jgi:hypothetical protein
MQVLRFPEFDIDADVLGEAPHLQTSLLAGRQLGGVSHQRVKALLVIVDRVVEGQPRKLGEAVAAYRRPEAHVAEFSEALPGWRALRA